jgi:uncharacterized protein (TIGR00266 family)
MDSAVRMLPDQGHAHGLDYRIEFRPTAALATLTLPPGHTVRAESGAMVSMGGDVTLDSSMEGGLWGAVKRSAGGRSGFVSRFSGPGDLALAPPAPGDVVPVELTGRPYAIAAHGYLASSDGVEIESGWGGARSFFASDSAFVLRASGTGVVLLSAFGALAHRSLAPGERHLVDTGHLIAWPADSQYTLRKAARSLFRSVTSGAGLVAEFTGPADLLLQTRDLRALATALTPHLPKPAQDD